MTPNYQEYVARLAIQLGAYKTGSFTLASGRQSNHYFNAKPLLLHPVSMRLLTSWVLRCLYELTEWPIAIGGLELGAVPIAVSCSVQSERPLNAFIVRKKTKDHGTALQVEGNLQPEDRVVVVDDVITTGGSTIKAIEAVESLGCKVTAVLCIVDREEGHLPRLGAYKDRFRSLFTLSSFLELRSALGVVGS